MTSISHQGAVQIVYLHFVDVFDLQYTLPLAITFTF